MLNKKFFRNLLTLVLTATLVATVIPFSNASASTSADEYFEKFQDGNLSVDEMMEIWDLNEWYYDISTNSDGAREIWFFNEDQLSIICVDESMNRSEGSDSILGFYPEATSAPESTATPEETETPESTEESEVTTPSYYQSRKKNKLILIRAFRNNKGILKKAYFNPKTCIVKYNNNVYKNVKCANFARDSKNLYIITRKGELLNLDTNKTFVGKYSKFLTNIKGLAFAVQKGGGKIKRIK